MPGDQFPVYKFWVQIDSELAAGFTECSGLQAEVDVQPYEEGGANGHAHQLPGRVKYSNVVLRGGVANAVNLWEWFNNTAMGKIERKNLSIVLYNARGEEVIRWNLVEAFPVRWTGPDLKTESNAIAIQSLDIAHHGFTVEQKKLLGPGAQLALTPG